MALKDLERLTGELQGLAAMLKAETRPQARWVILRRVHEIVALIGVDCSDRSDTGKTGKVDQVGLLKGLERVGNRHE